MGGGVGRGGRHEVVVRAFWDVRVGECFFFEAPRCGLGADQLEVVVEAFLGGEEFL